MFDLSIPKLLVLAVIALVIFGPDELPKIASQAGRTLRAIAEGAKKDLREGLGQEFTDFEIEDLNPRRFAHKHLFGDLNPDQRAQQQSARQAAAIGAFLAPSKSPSSPSSPTDNENGKEPE